MNYNVFKFFLSILKIRIVFFAVVKFAALIMFKITKRIFF